MCDLDLCDRTADLGEGGGGGCLFKTPFPLTGFKHGFHTHSHKSQTCLGLGQLF